MKAGSVFPPIVAGKVEGKTACTWARTGKTWQGEARNGTFSVKF